MEQKSFNYMNVIPLVDVMLVLLTIVLMTSTFMASGIIPVALPQSSTAKVEPQRTHAISIDRQGIIYFDSIPVSLSGLKQHVQPLDRTAPQVRADRNITVQACMDVLDLLAGEGFKKVGLQTEKQGSK
jgi:biopolymer transport protein ExbD